ncbi:MAG: SDR family oxidoreductase [Lachnospiraceae bacterium]|nr:SDR family oxidoreductase [Lachnospiraceae bacterium]
MKKYAVITGASSGIGREMARQLYKMGYALVLVARREDRLLELKKELGDDNIILKRDLSKLEDILSLVSEIEKLDVSIFVNNAGFGDCGPFSETSLEKELSMIELNVKTLHILTKHMVRIFEEKGEGYILNIGSSAGLFPAGPYMATYYATKSYVVSLTEAIARELKEKNSNTYIGVLCPGPVNTEFNNVANVEFSLKGISAKDCVSYAIKMMFKKKVRIIPTLSMKLAIFGGRFVSRNMLIKLTGHQQKKKIYR